MKKIVLDPKESNQKVADKAIFWYNRARHKQYMNDSNYINTIAQTFKVVLEKHNIIVVEITGNVNDVESNVKQAELIIDRIKNIFANIEEQKFHFLVLLTTLGTGAHYPSPQARKLYASMLDDSHIDRIAIVAPNTLIRSIMRFVIYAAARERQGAIRFFRSANAARDWLRGDKKDSEKIIVRP